LHICYTYNAISNKGAKNHVAPSGGVLLLKFLEAQLLGRRLDRCQIGVRMVIYFDEATERKHVGMSALTPIGIE